MTDYITFFCCGSLPTLFQLWFLKTHKLAGARTLRLRLRSRDKRICAYKGLIMTTSLKYNYITQFKVPSYKNATETNSTCKYEGIQDILISASNE